MKRQDIEARLRKAGIGTLLPLQEEMAALALPARILLQAPTGSGKTIAFVIALLRRLGQHAGAVQALVVSPTRELATQIYHVLRPLAAPEYHTTPVYGGHDYTTEARSLAAMPDIVVGTPGRIVDHLQRGRLGLSGVHTLVIDEYDKALQLGFAEQMQVIMQRCRQVSTLVLTSATSGDIPDFVGGVDRTLDYRRQSGEAIAPAVETYRIISPTADKLETLGALTDSLGRRRTIVFVNHREAADRIFKYLGSRRSDVCLYHGGLDQQQRERAIILFDNGTCPLMVATDLAARGLDIAGVQAVIHYHLPADAEAFTHRNGRTGRMGAVGKAFAIISEKDAVPPFMAGLSDAPHGDIGGGQVPPTATLYFNAGRKEKISRGDIVGFLIAKGGLQSQHVGRIDVKDHCAYVAVSAAMARQTVKAVEGQKIKNMRVRVTQLKEY